MSWKFHRHYGMYRERGVTGHGNSCRWKLSALRYGKPRYRPIVGFVLVMMTEPFGCAFIIWVGKCVFNWCTLMTLHFAIVPS